MTDQRDLNIRQGATWPGLAWPIFAPADGVTPLDLAGWTARAQVRPDAPSATLYWTWSTAPDAGEGTAEIIGHEVGIALTAAESAQFSWGGPAGYDVKLTSPDGRVLVIPGGAVLITRTYTRE